MTNNLELGTGFEPARGILPTAYKAVAVSRLATPALFGSPWEFRDPDLRRVRALLCL